MDVLREEGGNIIVKLQLTFKQNTVHAHHKALRQPPPPQHKWGTQRRGGRAVKIEKSLGDRFVSQNDDSTRG